MTSGATCCREGKVVVTIAHDQQRDIHGGPYTCTECTGGRTDVHSQLWRQRAGDEKASVN